MGTTDSIQEVYQWKNHRVTQALRDAAREQKTILIELLLTNRIDQNNIGEKNFQLGKLEILNYILSEEVFDDLNEEMELRYGKK